MNARFGQTVAGVGDVNNDGNDDVLIGAPLWDGGLTDEGRAHLYYEVQTVFQHQWLGSRKVKKKTLNSDQL